MKRRSFFGVIAAALIPKPSRAVKGKNTRFILRPTGDQPQWDNTNASYEHMMLDYTSTGEPFWRIRFPDEGLGGQ